MLSGAHGSVARTCYAWILLKLNTFLFLLFNPIVIVRLQHMRRNLGSWLRGSSR